MNTDVLVLNAGSSSLKFALFQGVERVASGSIQRVGRADSEMKLAWKNRHEPQRRAVEARDHAACVGLIWDELTSQFDPTRIAVVAHRIVHGGPRFFAPQRVTPEILKELRRLSPFDPQHLPAEIALIEAVSARCEGVPQIACFDTHFHEDLPQVARLLPIPRRYEAAGIRRYGFHGLSYQFLLDELNRLGEPAAKSGRVILAHLGNGASMAAVHDGRSVDTSMGFTPAGGLVMGTRAGDLDPGLVGYLENTENMSSPDFARLINQESGLIGISETSSDMRELLANEAGDVRARDAVDVFCYQAKKWLGAFAAALGGLDTLVFAGGIGENCPPVRERICAGLGFLGLALDVTMNAQNAAIVSSGRSRVIVRVVQTDEEQVIARAANRLMAEEFTRGGR
jgi:acetate kinase